MNEETRNAPPWKWKTIWNYCSDPKECERTRNAVSNECNWKPVIDWTREPDWSVLKTSCIPACSRRTRRLAWKLSEASKTLSYEDSFSIMKEKRPVTGWSWKGWDNTVPILSKKEAPCRYWSPVFSSHSSMWYLHRTGHNNNRGQGCVLHGSYQRLFMST
jgi:hypothetical protein